MGYMGSHYRIAMRNIAMLKERREQKRDLVKAYQDVKREGAKDVAVLKKYSKKELAEMRLRVAQQTKVDNRKRLIGVLIAAIVVGVLFYYILQGFM